MEYTLKEYCNMYLLLGMCGNRANVAARKYAERYLACCLLNTYVFHQLDQRMRESGSGLLMPSMDRGQPHTCQTPALEEIVESFHAKSSQKNANINLTFSDFSERW
jgi:hypothetical protein